MKTKKLISIILVILLITGSFAFATIFNASAEDGWELVWNDEFSGSSVDTTRWDVFNTSKMAPRAGYTEFQEDNAIVKDGKLIIQNEIGGCEAGSSARYTSARLMTMDMFKYGKFEIRAKCAEASGTNSAFWTWGFPNDPNYEFHYFTHGKGSEDFDWRYGEIEVIERFNYPSWGASRYRSVYSQLHFIGPYKKGDIVYTDKSEWGKTTYDTVKPGDVASWLDPGVDYGDTWHTFGFEWNADAVKLFRDGVQYGTLDLRYTSDTYPTAADAMDVFREYCQKIILSDWLGGDTVSGNSTFQIDYLRIWQKPGCYINYNEYGTSAYNAAKKVQTMDTKLATHTPYYYQPELKGDASYKIFDADASSVTYPSLPQNASADSIATHGKRKALKIKRGTQYDNVCIEFPGDYSTVAKNAKYLRTWVAAEDGAMYYADQKGGISYGFRTTDGKYYFANGEKGLNYCASNIAYSGNYYWVDLNNLMLTETGVHKYTATDGRVFGDRLMDVKSGQTTPFSSIAGKIDAVYVNFGVISGMGTATGVNKCYFIDDLEFVNDATVEITSSTSVSTSKSTVSTTTTKAPSSSSTSTTTKSGQVVSGEKVIDWNKQSNYYCSGTSSKQDGSITVTDLSASSTRRIINSWDNNVSAYDGIKFTVTANSGNSSDIQVQLGSFDSGFKAVSGSTEFAIDFNEYNIDPSSVSDINFYANGAYNFTISDIVGYKNSVTPTSSSTSTTTTTTTTKSTQEANKVVIDGVEIENDGIEFTLPVSSKDGFVAYFDGTNFYDANTKITIDTNKTFTTVAIGKLQMLKGASIRLGSVNGIRYYTQADPNMLASLPVGTVVSKGTLITPIDLLGNEELTLNASCQKVNIPYKSDKYYQNNNTFVGSIVNIKEGNITREFTGRGYITITYGNFTKTIYATVNDNNRSIAYIANNYKADLSSDYSELNTSLKELVDKWADKYKSNNNNNIDFENGDISMVSLVGTNVSADVVDKNSSKMLCVKHTNDYDYLGADKYARIAVNAENATDITFDAFYEGWASKEAHYGVEINGVQYWDQSWDNGAITKTSATFNLLDKTLTSLNGKFGVAGASTLKITADNIGSIDAILIRPINHQNGQLVYVDNIKIVK